MQRLIGSLLLLSSTAWAGILPAVVTPEPSTLMMFGSGLAAVLYLRHRRKGGK